MSYPKWIYFKDQTSKLVKSKDEHEKYPESKESPVDFEAEEALADLDTEIKDEKLQSAVESKQLSEDEAQAAQSESDEKAETYKEHMEQWESKEEAQAPKEEAAKPEKKSKKKKANQ